MIGVIHDDGFEVVNAGQIASVGVGMHPKVKERLDRRMGWTKKTYGGEGKEASS